MTLLTAIRKFLGDDSGTTHLDQRWSDEEILYYINQAYYIVVNDFKGLTFRKTLVLNQELRHKLPDNFIDIRRVQLFDNLGVFESCLLENSRVVCNRDEELSTFAIDKIAKEITFNSLIDSDKLEFLASSSVGILDTSDTTGVPTNIQGEDSDNRLITNLFTSPFIEITYGGYPDKVDINSLDTIPSEYWELIRYYVSGTLLQAHIDSKEEGINYLRQFYNNLKIFSKDKKPKTTSQTIQYRSL